MASNVGDDPSGDGVVDKIVSNHEVTVQGLNRAYAQLTEELIPRVAGLAVISHPVLIPWREQITERVSQTLRLLVELDRQMKLLMLSAALPFRLWDLASEWVQVRASVSSVAGDLGVTNREIHHRWQGLAADTYHAVLPAHVGAASRLATVADTVPFALNQAASAIAQLYAAILGLIVGLFGAAMLSLAAASTVVGAPVAVVLLLVLVGTTLTLVSSAVVNAAQAIAASQTWLTRMLSDMHDNAAFPGGQWPAARSDLLTDATVADGDPSDWTVRS